MAVLTVAELAAAREAKNRDSETATWDRSAINAAMQAVEDLLEQTSTKNAVGSAIETAAPGKFSAAQKRRLFFLVCALKARSAGVT